MCNYEDFSTDHISSADVCFAHRPTYVASLQWGFSCCEGVRVSVCGKGLAWVELPTCVKEEHTGLLISFLRCGAEGSREERGLKTVKHQNIDSEFLLQKC